MTRIASHWHVVRTKVSEKGQIAIPKTLRDELGIRAGMELHAGTERGLLVAARVEPVGVVLSVTGVLREVGSAAGRADGVHTDAVAMIACAGWRAT